MFGWCVGDSAFFFCFGLWVLKFKQKIEGKNSPNIIEIKKTKKANKFKLLAFFRSSFEGGLFIIWGVSVHHFMRFLHQI
jgi:hypothetical protein